MELNKVYHMDFMDNTLPDKSVQLIIADPPYFEVKGEFDFIWASFDDYLADVEKWAQECKRLLADNGSLYWYGHAKKIAYSQVILDKYFNLENSLVWRKVDSMQYQYYSVNLSRSYNTHNERILFYSKEVGQTGFEKIMEEHIKPLHPFAKYLDSEFNRAGVSRKEIAALFPSKTGRITGCVSNWLNGDNVITEEQYLKIRQYLNGEYLRKDYEELRKDYEELRKDYEELRKDYEELRRPFNNINKYEDVLEFSQEGHITKQYEHETKKPEKMTRAFINISSRKGDTILAPFAGSGTECAMAIREGRKCIGFDVNEKYVDMANNRITKELLTPTLF